LKQNEIKVRVGTAAQMDILDSKAEKASKESEVLQAENSIKTSDEELKKVLNLTRETFQITPADQPEIRIMKGDFNQFLLEAFQSRPDIASAKLDLKSKNIDVKYYRNQMLPDLQLQASYYTTGQGGKQFLYAPGADFFNRVPIGSITKDIWDSMQEALANLYKNYSVSLNLSIPLSLDRERAQLTRAKLSLKNSLLQLKKTENTIYSEVKQALMQLEGNLKLVNANKIRLDLEKAKLKAEEKKFSVGLSTPFNVLQKRRDLSSAQTMYLNSVRSYLMTIAGINRSLARTFKVYSIKFESIEKKLD
jgi:outer membrane protein TolC